MNDEQHPALEEQLPMMVMESFEQLKAVSDPFRSKLLMHLIEQSYTGQQLAKLMEVPRSKVHYALTELESHGLIALVRKEEVSGIVQKYYKAVARSFWPSSSLLPQASAIENYRRNMTLNTLSRAMSRAMSAPEEAFLPKESELEQEARISMQVETKISQEDFQKWLKKYRELVQEFYSMKSDNGNYYYLTTVGFQIDEPLFEDNVKEEEREKNQQNP